MENKLRSFFQLWTNLTPPQRVVVSFFAAALVVTTVVLAVVASRPDYTVLFSNLRPEDAAAIVQKLRDSKVPYRVTANGTAIEVPSASVYEVRLNLAGQGLPQGGNVGFEIFDKNSLGVTDFSQKMSYLRALQGELQRTISSLDGVSDARVHIVLPDDSLYSSEKKDASASVLLRLDGSRPPSDEQVAGIVNLVSAAVEGLKPERVSVVDTRGNVLADGSGQGRDSLRLTATQLDIKRATERAIRSDVESMLDRVAGPGKAVVRVSARMSFDQKQTTSEIFEPAGGGTQGVIASQERTREVYGAGARAVGGVPGTASNVQPPAQRPAAAPAAGQTGYEREQESTRFNVSRRTETVEGAPGQIEQLSVAVMVDREVGPEKLAAIRQAATAAAGIDQARGDRIVVESVEFPKEETAGKAPLAASLGKYLNIGRNTLAILLLVGFALFIRGALARQNITVENPQAEPAALRADGAPALAGAGEDLAAGASPPAAALQKVEMPELTIPLESAKELAKQQPEEIANVVRTWMSDERRAA